MSTSVVAATGGFMLGVVVMALVFWIIQMEPNTVRPIVINPAVFPHLHEALMSLDPGLQGQPVATERFIEALDFVRAAADLPPIDQNCAILGSLRETEEALAAIRAEQLAPPSPGL